MCCVLAWKGIIPPSFLRTALHKAKFWGLDATGIAWRSGKDIKISKQAVDADQFVKDCKDEIIEAAASGGGIAHCRAASSGTDKTNIEAHPHYELVEDRHLVWAHNGYITNWKSLRSTATVDSQVLGASISNRNFGTVYGSFGLVWIDRDKVYFAKNGRELSAFSLKSDEYNFSFACTVAKIVPKTAKKFGLKSEKFKIEEGELYSLTPKQVLTWGKITVNKPYFATTELAAINNATGSDSRSTGYYHQGNGYGHVYGNGFSRDENHGGGGLPTL